MEVGKVWKKCRCEKRERVKKTKSLSVGSNKQKGGNPCLCLLGGAASWCGTIPILACMGYRFLCWSNTGSHFNPQEWPRNERRLTPFCLWLSAERLLVLATSYICHSFLLWHLFPTFSCVFCFSVLQYLSWLCSFYILYTDDDSYISIENSVYHTDIFPD